MKKVCIVFLILLSVSVFAQTSIPSIPSMPSYRIEGSDIVLNNMTRAEVDRIMQGSIFDVFNLDLRSYNTDLRKMAFLETDEGRIYQVRLEELRTRLVNQGILVRRIAANPGVRTTNSPIPPGISNYDVDRGGFSIGFDGGAAPGRAPVINIQPVQVSPGFQGMAGSQEISSSAPSGPNISGFVIPNIDFSIITDFNPRYRFTIFIPVPASSAARIEDNRGRIDIQLQLAVDTFALERVFLIDSETNEIYAESVF